MIDISKAYTPYRMNRIQVKNRFVRSAGQTFMGNTDGTLSEQDFEYYQELMDGGVGLIILGHAYVDPKYGKASDRQASFADDSVIPQYRRIAEMAKKTDTRVVAQISHTGGRSTTLSDHICPSASELRPGLFSKEMTRQQIRDVIRYFGAAAQRAQRAGLDGVELHAAHLYLLSQFATPAINHRTDEYGGSPENRFRIIREIIAEIRKTCGEEFPIMIKVNCNAPVDLDGFKVAPDKNSAVQTHAAKHYDQSYWDDICYVVSELDKLDLEFIEVSGYDFVDWKKEDHQFYVKYAEKLRKLAPHTTLFPVGGITSPQDVADVLNAGFEMISMCRALHSEPDIIRKFKEGKESRCLHCNKCFVVPYSTGKCCVFHIKEKA